MITRCPSQPRSSIATLLAFERSQAAIADVASDPPPFEDQSDPVELFRAATLDQQHISRKQHLAQRFRCIACAAARVGDRRPGHAAPSCTGPVRLEFVVEHDQMRRDRGNALAQRLIDRPLRAGWLGHRPEQHDAARRRDLGKNVTLKREFEADELRRRLDIRDTDVLIGRNHGGHVFGLFLDEVSGSDRSRALSEIERVESEFLRDFYPERPTLIVAGPGVVIRRPEWNDFRNRIKPRCFYLVMDAVGVLEALNRRYADEAKLVGQEPSFQSWNQDATSKYNPKTQRWERIGYEKAIKNITKRMEQNVREYEAASKPADRSLGGAALRENLVAKTELVGRIRGHFGPVTKKPK